MIPKYNNRNHAFHDEFNRLVDFYFEMYKLKITGDWRLYLKATILFAKMILVYVTLMYFASSTLAIYLLWALLGIVFALIGFNIMHDASHESFSSIPWVNNLMARTLEIMGASSFMWHYKHVILHHRFTNTHHDDDINTWPPIRMRREDRPLGIHKYQAYYAVVAYSLLYFAWVFYKDFQKYFHGHIGEYKIKKMPTSEHLIFWCSKVLYVFLFIVFPIYKLGITHALVGYLIFGSTCGLFISIVFQLAHAVETSTFPKPDPVTNKIETPWAESQLQETMDFGTNSKILFWLLGGLNFQTVHHLAPKISHVHYPALSRILERVAKTQNPKLVYNKKSLWGALRSHFRFLDYAGNRMPYVPLASE